MADKVRRKHSPVRDGGQNAQDQWQWPASRGKWREEVEELGSLKELLEEEEDRRQQMEDEV